MYGYSFVHRCIKPEATGVMLKNKIANAGYTVKDIQKAIGLSCPQPIYRWFKGFALPSIDNMYALSRLFGVHMEQLVISTNFDYCDRDLLNGMQYRKWIISYAELKE